MLSLWRPLADQARFGFLEWTAVQLVVSFLLFFSAALDIRCKNPHAVGLKTRLEQQSQIGLVHLSYSLVLEVQTERREQASEGKVETLAPASSGGYRPENHKA